MMIYISNAYHNTSLFMTESAIPTPYAAWAADNRERIAATLPEGTKDNVRAHFARAAGGWLTPVPAGD
jgi:hypothetical protein